MYESLIGNDNAETWTIEIASKFMDSALELSMTREYDFIGEIARDLKSYKEVFSYLSGKFPELKTKHNTIISNCEANCFYNGKKSNIVPSLAIMNLKSNHGWTDRQEINNNVQFGKTLFIDEEIVNDTNPTGE